MSTHTSSSTTTDDEEDNWITEEDEEDSLIAEEVERKVGEMELEDEESDDWERILQEGKTWRRSNRADNVEPEVSTSFTTPEVEVQCNTPAVRNRESVPSEQCFSCQQQRRGSAVPTVTTNSAIQTTFQSQHTQTQTTTHYLIIPLLSWDFFNGLKIHLVPFFWLNLA